MTDVVIIGAGLAGLVCAQDLTAEGLEVTLLEASDGVGGRVCTDVVDGHRLDRGFQILLTAYPQVAQRLDVAALDIQRFDPGAVVRRDGVFHRVGDPLRRPRQLPSTLRAPIGTLSDKVKVGLLALDVRRHGVRELLQRPDTTTGERLRALGFSGTMLESFWQPLFAGIGLDPDLEVSSRRFDAILRMLAIGDTGVPAEGMGAIPAQLAATLPEGTVRLGAEVASVDGRSATLADGEVVTGRAVVVATEGPAAHRLLGRAVPDPGSRAAACLWLSAPTAPVEGPVLVLDGDRSGPVRNLAVMSEVAPSYAPESRALIAAAVPGPDALSEDLVARSRDQLARWFGPGARSWELLRTDVIPHGQPTQGPPLHPKQPVELGDGLFVCGDHRDTASIQGAMFSGERTARAVRHHLVGG